MRPLVTCRIGFHNQGNNFAVLVAQFRTQGAFVVV